jgi:hypothetical protein
LGWDGSGIFQNYVHCHVPERSKSNAEHKRAAVVGALFLSKIVDGRVQRKEEDSWCAFLERKAEKKEKEWWIKSI